jgi:hypothetical protein
MTKTALTLLALAGLLVPASAFAHISTPSSAAATVAPMLALPRIPVETAPISCEMQLGSLIAKMNKPEYYDTVRASPMIMVGNRGHAEACRPVGNEQGFCDEGTDASVSRGELAGSSSVVAFQSNDPVTVGFRIGSVDGVAKIKWRFRGKSYAAAVDSCSAGYWTATASTSAIVIKVDKPKVIPPPPG